MQNPRNKVEVDGKLSYQWKKQQEAMKWVRNWRTAVDVGAHVGLWSMHLVKRFQIVHAFEPVAEHRECFAKNIPKHTGETVLYPYALGEVEGACSIEVPYTSSGGSHVSGSGKIPIKRLDDFDLQEVDFLKIDCEGYEDLVLKGARETLLTWMPCVIVEQKPHKLSENFGIKGTPAVDYLKSLGAIVRAEMSGDYVMTWT